LWIGAWRLPVGRQVVEGQTQDAQEKVDGIASEIALRPPPIEVFEDQSIEGRQLA